MDIITITQCLTKNTPIIAIIISVITLVKTSFDNRRMLEESSRAYISIYTDTLIANKSHFYIIIKNFGNTNAMIQNIEIDKKTKKMIKLGSTECEDCFNSLIKSQLAPGQSITHAVMTDNEEYDYSHISKFKISYKSGRKRYSDEFEINLSINSTMPSMSISTDGTGEQFKKLFIELYQDQIRKSL